MLIDSKALLELTPDRITDPWSIPSGLSWAFLRLTAGNFSIDDSSVIVPLSERTQKAFC